MRRKNRNSSLKTSSIAYLNCPAKTYLNHLGEIKLGRNVFNHYQIVGHVAKRLLENLPKTSRQQISPKGSELLAAAHDLGKVSPIFFLKLQTTVGCSCAESYPHLSALLGLNETRWRGHAGFSALFLRSKGRARI